MDNVKEIVVVNNIVSSAMTPQPCEFFLLLHNTLRMLTVGEMALVVLVLLPKIQNHPFKMCHRQSFRYTFLLLADFC